MEIARAALLGLVALACTPALAFDLQGHRGARGLAPENTLPAFERALEIGVTTLELDVGVTRDGVVVIHHDRRLNADITRDASGQWLAGPGPSIGSMTWVQLQHFDVGRLKPGSDYARRYPVQQPIDGTRIPRLADLFALVKRRGDERVQFSIETKLSPEAPEETLPPEAFALAVIDEIRRAGLQRRAAIQSFDWRSLQAVQRFAPEIPTVYLTAQQRWLDNVAAGKAEGSGWTAGFQHREYGSVPKMVKAAGGTYWSAYFGDLDESQVREARAMGLKVLAWTVSDPAAMERMIDLGVDGLITDRPDLARAVLERRGINW